MFKAFSTEMDNVIDDGSDNEMISNYVEEESSQEPKDSIKSGRSKSSNTGSSQRKSSRSTRWKASKDPLVPKTSTRGKSRRGIFKKKPYKSPEAIVTPMTSSFIYLKGVYLQVGDVVSIMDEDGSLYYAQLRGFLTDQYSEKSACITWLIPTQESPKDGSFDADTFVLGPEEDIPRKLEYMEFVQHAPVDHFSRSALSKLSCPDLNVNSRGYIWTRLGVEKSSLS